MPPHGVRRAARRVGGLLTRTVTVFSWPRNDRSDNLKLNSVTAVRVLKDMASAPVPRAEWGGAIGELSELTSGGWVMRAGSGMFDLLLLWGEGGTAAYQGEGRRSLSPVILAPSSSARPVVAEPSLHALPVIADLDRSDESCGDRESCHPARGAASRCSCLRAFASLSDRRGIAHWSSSESSRVLMGRRNSRR